MFISSPSDKFTKILSTLFPHIDILQVEMLCMALLLHIMTELSDLLLVLVDESYINGGHILGGVCIGIKEVEHQF